MEYDRAAAVAYARQWAFRRNPEYYNFDAIGGDCTNFVSQCVYAGAGIMNFTPEFGWYYISPELRAPAWTSVRFFYDFMTTNEGTGPFGFDVPLEEAEPGDVIQLAYNDPEVFEHTLLVVYVGSVPSLRNILLAAHTRDVFAKRLSSYTFKNARLIKISGVRE